MSISAQTFFSRLGAGVTLAGCSMLIASVMRGTLLTSLQPPTVVTCSVVVASFATIFGPLRASFAVMPQEIKYTLRTVGTCVPALAALLVCDTVVADGLPLSLFQVLGPICVIRIGLAFYAMGSSFPISFTISEMVGVVSSAKFTGDSINQREMARWTGNKIEGLPVGAKAPDVVLTRLTDESSVTLKSLLQESGPTVLNFGSYTCPHHRKRLPELNALEQSFKKKGVQFVTIYISEAHPEDGWKIPGQYREDSIAEFKTEESYCFYYSKTMEDRSSMAKTLVAAKDISMQVLLDNMHDEALHLYNAWPIRLYVVQDGVIRYSGKQGPFGYQPAEVEKVLRNLTK